MSTGFGRRASQDLARVGLTLAPRRGSGPRVLALSLLAIAAFAAGVGAGELLHEQAPALVVRVPAGPSAELVQLRLQLEQARMGARVSDARSHELEHQIDTLNQKLTESQDELSFFRKAREGKKPH
jgi:hypothetical protein